MRATVTYQLGDLVQSATGRSRGHVIEIFAPTTEAGEPEPPQRVLVRWVDHVTGECNDEWHLSEDVPPYQHSPSLWYLTAVQAREALSGDVSLAVAWIDAIGLRQPAIGLAVDREEIQLRIAHLPDGQLTSIRRAHPNPHVIHIGVDDPL